MPWIDKNICTGCGVCSDNCPADAIQIVYDEKAEINMEECIRCGECHDICPVEAVRHDSEKIPEKVERNIQTACRLLDKCRTKDAKITYIDKYIKAFNLEQKVSRQSIEKLEAMKKDLA
jgi:ferredoxin